MEHDAMESDTLDPGAAEAGADAEPPFEDTAPSAAEGEATSAGDSEVSIDDLGEETGRAPADTISEHLREELRELEELRDRHLRLAAEFDNYKRRTRKEILESRGAAQAALTAELLDALDDLTRVADVPADSTTTEALHEGVALVERKLLKALTDAGMEAISPLGERFDPNLHEAIFAAETDDPEQDDLVSQVVVIGYKFGDRLLRPARVGVYQYDPDAQPA
jgi:molecular chaperone GrpE